MTTVVLSLLIIGLHIYWIYAVCTYDWSNFESVGGDFFELRDSYEWAWLKDRFNTLYPGEK
jgi:hypothetical protein